MGVRIRLLCHHQNRQALGPSVLSPHVSELSHHPQIQDRPLWSRRRERPLGARHLHRLYFRVRSDHSILGPNELRPVYQHESILAVHGYTESLHGYFDINLANICGMEASGQEVTEGCDIGNLPFGRLVRRTLSNHWTRLMVHLCACSVCLSSIVRTCFVGKVDIEDPTCVFPIRSGLHFSVREIKSVSDPLFNSQGRPSMQTSGPPLSQVSL